MTTIVTELPELAARNAGQAYVPSSAEMAEVCNGLDTPRCALVAERQDSALREQFIAVLGHDLRNPLSAIISGMDIMARSPLNPQPAFVTTLVQTSVARMSALIDDVMDFARGRLGNGMSLERQPVQLQPVLVQVLDELRSSQPHRPITAAIDLPEPVNCDRGRLCQLLSNLVANALVHGSKTGDVQVRAACEDAQFVLSVSNSGEPMTAAAISRLFQPFTRDAIRPSQQGLGLGLYIASEIAHAHGGSLDATSRPDETFFTFRMPLNISAAEQPSH